MITMFKPLLNNGSKNLAVDGTTPKTFSYVAEGIEVVTGFVCILKDEGASDLSKFGGRNSLTNGILIQATQALYNQGSARTIASIKDSADLCKAFPINHFGNGAVLSVLGVSTPQGFGGSNNTCMGFLDFHPCHSIDLQSGDSVSVLIQDNLTGVDVFEISARVVKE